MTGTDNGWGKVFIASRREKVTDSQFTEHFDLMLATGIRRGDSFSICSGRPAHWAANELVERFLQSECDSILFIDSDCKMDGNTLSQLRDLQEGWAYDLLSAFYVRRGWPPEAIWMKRQPDGNYKNVAVLKEITDDVDAVGLHFCLIRRKVFSGVAGPDWFWYPKRTRPDEHRKSEDVAFSESALAAGFKIGSTSKVQTGHYSVMPTGWETHHEWLRINQIVNKFGVGPDGRPLDPEAYAKANWPNGVNHESTVLA